MQYVQNRHKMFGICMLVNEWMEWGGVVDRRCMYEVHIFTKSNYFLHIIE